MIHTYLPLQQAQREYDAAHAELMSLDHHASASRVERAMERLAAAREALALAA